MGYSLQQLYEIQDNYQTCGTGKAQGGSRCALKTPLFFLFHFLLLKYWKETTLLFKLNIIISTDCI